MGSVFHLQLYSICDETSVMYEALGSEDLGLSMDFAEII